MSKNCGKIGLPVKFLHLSVRIFTKWWLRKNYKWNKLEKNSVSMEEIKKGQEECSRLLEIQISLLLAPLIRAQAVDERGVCWTQGLHPFFDLLSLYLTCLFVFWQSFSDRTTFFLSSFPSMYVLLQSITERLHDQLLINSRTLETAPILETPPFFSLVKHKTGFTFTCWPGRCRAVLAFFPFSVEIRALSRQLIKNTVLVASSNTLKMQMWRHDKIRKSFRLIKLYREAKMTTRTSVCLFCPETWCICSKAKKDAIKQQK